MNLPAYDRWKLDNPWDEEDRRLHARRIPCADCDTRYATVCAEDLTGYLGHDEYLCEECADKREQRMLDDAAHDDSETL